MTRRMQALLMAGLHLGLWANTALAQQAVAQASPQSTKDQIADVVAEVRNRGIQRYSQSYFDKVKLYGFYIGMSRTQAEKLLAQQGYTITNTHKGHYEHVLCRGQNALIQVEAHNSAINSRVKLAFTAPNLFGQQLVWRISIFQQRPNAALKVTAIDILDKYGPVSSYRNNTEFIGYIYDHTIPKPGSESIMSFSFNAKGQGTFFTLQQLINNVSLKIQSKSDHRKTQQKLEPFTHLLGGNKNCL